MNRIFLITICTILLGSLTSCKSDSDYTLGTYDVVTTVKTSTCPEDISSYFEDLILPSGDSPDQTQEQQWIIKRVGITGSGTDKIDLTITSPQDPDSSLIVSGNLEDGCIQIEEQRDITENEQKFYRFILVYGLIDDENFSGEIHTFLSDTRDSSSTTTHIPSFSPCEIHEEFVGKRQYGDS